jgi:imidazolonepropionase-like amidohydrolase
MLAQAGCAGSRPVSTDASLEPSFAIQNVRIFDGERLTSPGTVLVRGGRIVAVGQSVDVSGVSELIDGHGQTLLPGLIDSHFHADGPEAYRSAMAFGVTTVVDMFGQYSSLAMKKSLGALAQRGADEADTLVGLLITAPGGHGTQFGNVPMPTVTAGAECQAAVDAQLAAGASFVKLVYDSGETWSQKPIPTLSREALAACVQAAHARGALAVVHTWTLRQTREALEAGVDGLVHLAADTVPDQAFTQLIASRGAFVVPTLAVVSGVAHHHNDDDILADTRLAPYLTAANLSTLKATFPDGFGQGMKPTVMQQAVRQLKEARVPILAGSDCANQQTAIGASLHLELEQLVASGLTPTEALAAATSVPAARFRLPDRGRIAPGLRGDLLLVRGDPTQDIRMTRDIVAIWKQGQRLDREAFRARIDASRKAATKTEHASQPAKSGPPLE